MCIAVERHKHGYITPLLTHARLNARTHAHMHMHTHTHTHTWLSEGQVIMVHEVAMGRMEDGGDTEEGTGSGRKAGREEG